MPDLVFATKGQASVLRAQQAMADQAKALRKELDEDARAADKARAAIMKIYESTKTPQEQLKQRMDVLRKAIREGTAPPEAMEALKRLKSQYADTFGTAQKEIDKSKGKLKDLGDTQKKTFDSSIVSRWGLAVGGAVSAAVIASFKVIKDEQQKLAEDSKAAITSEGQLAQFADTPEQMAALLSESRAAYAMGVGRDRGTAAGALASMIGAGIEDPQDRLTLMRMQSSGLIDNAGEVAKAAKTIQSTYGGSLLSQLDRAFGAGEIAPGGASQLMIASSRSALTAKALGMTPDEVYGATAALSAGTGSESEGATLLDALLRALDKAGGFKGKSLNESIREITARVQGGEDLRGDTLLGGRAEAVRAYRFLAGDEGRALYLQGLRDSNRAVLDGTSTRRLSLAESADTNLAAARFAIVQEQQRNTKLLEEATFENINQGLLSEMRSEMDQMPGGLRQTARGLSTFTENVFDRFRSSEVMARSRSNEVMRPDSPAGAEARRLIESIDQQREIQKRQEELMKKQLRAMEDLNNKSSQGGLLIGGD